MDIEKNILNNIEDIINNDRNKCVLVGNIFRLNLIFWYILFYLYWDK